MKSGGILIIKIIIGGLLVWGVASIASDSDTDNSYNAVDSEYIDTSDASNYEEDTTNDYNTETFHGYDCTDDCSGHEAGYQWAEDNDITDEDNCDGNSNSFNEGCRAYVEEN